MKTKIPYYIAFILLVVAQLYIVFKMVWDQETVLENGKAFKFEAQPIDPNDPFRGKYVSLRFKENQFHSENEEEWHNDQVVYVTLKDSAGYAKIAHVFASPPTDEADYLTANIDYITTWKTSTPIIRIEYPSERFYMEEHKAPQAESLYNTAVRDTNQKVYALVYVKEGTAAIQDVFIDEMPLNEWVKQQSEKNNEPE